MLKKYFNASRSQLQCWHRRVTSSSWPTSGNTGQPWAFRLGQDRRGREIPPGDSRSSQGHLPRSHTHRLTAPWGYGGQDGAARSWGRVRPVSRSGELLPGTQPGARAGMAPELAWRKLPWRKLPRGRVTILLGSVQSPCCSLQGLGPFRPQGPAHRTPQEQAGPLDGVWTDAARPQPGLARCRQTQLHVRLHTQPLHPAHVALHGHAAGDAPGEVLGEPACLSIPQPLAIEPSWIQTPGR